MNPSAPGYPKLAKENVSNFHAGLKGPSARVELALSATNLADMDTFSKSDPLCVVEELLAKGPQMENGFVEIGRTEWILNSFVEIGRTEWILNSLNPKWNKKVCLEYHFERKQRLRFSLFDVDDPADAANLSKHDFLGKCECELADIVAAPNGVFQMAISDAPRNSRNGRLTVCAVELEEGQHECLYFACSGESLKSGTLWDCSCFGQSLVFLEFSRLIGDGSRQMVHRTEVVRSLGSPQWRPFELTVKCLCEGDKGREFLIDCYEQRATSGNHKLIGSARTTVAALIDRHRQIELKSAGGGGEVNGILRFNEVEVRQQYTFLDYISSGLELEFAVAVDLTASNGEVSSPTSLHFVHSQYLNQYECAVGAVLEICEHYNHSKQFEALGFGAQVPPAYQVSHMFPLTLDNARRYVEGVHGVMDAYKYAVRNTQLYGPTNFAPTIRAFLEKCKQMPRDGTRYQVLLILTDGIITDMQQTTEAIIQASYQPLSIIIIGIGAEDFAKMEFLDSDNQLLTYNGRSAVRDIVQFVPFRDFVGATWATTPEKQSQLKAILAKEVLAELPDQVVSFMKAYKIAPSFQARTENILLG